MTTFKIFHDLSYSAGTEIPQIVGRSSPTSPGWLISAYEIYQDPSSLVSKFGIRERDLQRWALDNGGYSLISGTHAVGDIEPKHYARICNSLPFAVVIAPDAPLFWGQGNIGISAFMERSSLGTQTLRMSNFYAAYKKQSHQAALNVIHGPLANTCHDTGEDISTIRFRGSWQKSIDDLDGGKSGGHALAGLTGCSTLELAYFALQPWMLKSRFCHILGRADLQGIAALVYLARKTKMNVSVDAKTYTIDTIQNMRLLMPDQHGVPRDCKIDRKKKTVGRNGSFDNGCSCPICTAQEAEHGVSFKELVEADANGTTRDRNSTLHPWLSAHNIHAVESYVNSLRGTTDDKVYREILQRDGMKKSLTALDLIDKVLGDGREHYFMSVKYLQTAMEALS